MLYLTFLYLPDPLLYFLISIVAYVRSIMRIVTDFRMTVEIYEGNHNGYPVKMLWVGTGELRDYVVQLLYDSGHQVTRLESTNLIRLQKSIDGLSAQCDLIFVERSSLLPPLRGFKRIREKVQMLLSVEERNQKKYRNARRRARKYDIKFKDFKISEHLDKLRSFYEQMYAPHMSSRHGENTVESFDSIRIFYAKGVLRMAYYQGEAVAGAVLLHQDDTLVGCKYAVRDANQRAHRAAESYYLGLNYAENNNFAFLDAFHARPFINDSGFRYKREWRSNVCLETRNYYLDQDLYLKVVNYNPGVVSFLSANPFIFVRNGELVANLLCMAEDASLVDAMETQFHNCVTGGIARYEFGIRREITDCERDEFFRRCGVSSEDEMIAFINYGQMPARKQRQPDRTERYEWQQVS